MNSLSQFGAGVKKWIKENLGDLLIVAGLFLFPLATFFINKIISIYVLGAVLIIIGILYIKGVK